MRVVVLLEARDELRAARRHYVREAGVQVAARFLAEFHRVRTLVGRDPQRWAVLEGSARALPFGDHFPYSLVYVVRGAVVVIVAVMHQHREPGYWQERLHRER